MNVVVMVLLGVAGLLVVSTPIFVSLLLPAIAGFTFSGLGMPPIAVVQHGVQGIAMPALLAVPLFMFAADVIARGEIADRLVDLADSLVGHIPGGIAIATIVTMTVFGAISGVGVAAIVSIGPIAYPVLLRKGYSKSFALGLILSGSTLAMLIPPSVAVILYGLQANQSIAKTFLSALGAGLIFAALMILYSVWYVLRKGLGRDDRFSARRLAEALRRSVLALLFPVIILGGIYSGITTVTEAAAMAVAYAVIVEVFIYRRLTRKELFQVARQSSGVIAMVMILIVGGSLLTWFLTLEQIPQAIAKSPMLNDPIMVLAVINVVFLIAGMFVDVNSAIIVLTPLVFPAAASAGVDPIHLGAILTMNLAIGMISPPFGMNLFVGMATFRVGYGDVLKGILPFIMLQLIALVMVTYWPAATLWLPSLVSTR